MIPLPSYIDREAWGALIEARKAKRVPTTTYAAKLLLYELQRIKDAGHDPNAAIRQSILKGYTDVWPAKEKTIEQASSSDADKTTRMLKEQANRGYTAPPSELRLVANKLRKTS